MLMLSMFTGKWNKTMKIKMIGIGFLLLRYVTHYALNDIA